MSDVKKCKKMRELNMIIFTIFGSIFFIAMCVCLYLTLTLELGKKTYWSFLEKWIFCGIWFFMGLAIFCFMSIKNIHINSDNYKKFKCSKVLKDKRRNN